jgi:hypothetical protein
MSNILKGLIFEEEQTSYSIHLKDNDKPLLKYNSIPELKSAYAGLTKKYPDREFIIKKTSCSTTELGRPEFLESAQKISEEELNEDLRKWFKEKWVRFGPDGKIRGDCARGDDSEGKPKCLPQAKAHSLGKKGRKYAASKKRREDPNPERSGPAKNVATKKKSNESMVEGFSEIDEACWKGYHKEGNKKMFGKTYPNCVKNEDVAEGSDADEEEFIPQIYARVIPDTKSFIITKVLDANLGLKIGDKVSYIALTKGKFKDIPKSLSYKQDVAEEQLDELKCWPGYSRVQGVPAGAPGSCKKKTTESVEDLVQIEYWQQDTQESGQWAKTDPMSRDKAEQILSSFSRGEIVDDDTPDQYKEIIYQNGKPVGEVGTEPGWSDVWYEKCYANGRERGGYESRREAVASLRYSLRQQEIVKREKEEELAKQLGKQDVAEGQTGVSVKKWAAQVRQEHGADTKFSNDKVHNRIIARKDKEIVGSYNRKSNNGTVFSPEQDIKEESCPHCAGPMFSEMIMNEKKDACYYKVKSRYKVWPSAYASGALVKCRNKGAKNWGNKSESAIMRGLQSESLGTQYPSTYEEENEPFKRKGQRRIGTLTTEEKLSEKWSDKYKRSIDCSNPKGFSQRAHCQGKKKK